MNETEKTKTEPTGPELWRGNQRCACGWLLPRESQFDVLLDCSSKETVKHIFTFVMYCPQCGVAYEMPADEMKILVTQ